MVINEHAQLGGELPRIDVLVGHVPGKADGISGLQAVYLPVHTDLHRPLEYRDILLCAPQVGLGIQPSGGLDDNAVGLEQGGLIEGKDRIAEIAALVGLQGRPAPEGRTPPSFWGSTREVKETLYPLAIFHTTEMVGLTSPRSIWASMLRDTPVSSAAPSRVSFFRSRAVRTFWAMTSLTFKYAPLLLTI